MVRQVVERHRTLEADAVVEFMVDDVEVSSHSDRSVHQGRDEVRAALGQ